MKFLIFPIAISPSLYHMKRITFHSSVISLLLLSCQSLGLMAFFPGGNAAHAYTRYNSCDSAITASARKLSSFRNTSVVTTQIQESSYTVGDGRPQERTQDVMYPLTGKGVSAVLGSRKMLATLSENVLRNCSNVATVTFGVAATDGLLRFGILSNKIQYFDCHQEPGRSRAPYGKINCF
jgi:hypothetical protein